MLLTDSPPEVRGTVQNFTSDGHDLKTMSMEGEESGLAGDSSLDPMPRSSVKTLSRLPFSKLVHIKHGLKKTASS